MTGEYLSGSDVKALAYEWRCIYKLVTIHRGGRVEGVALEIVFERFEVKFAV